LPGGEVKELIGQEVDTDSKICDKVSALFLAAANGHGRVVQLLAENGASLSVRDHLGWTPLHRAADQGYTEVVHYLVQNGVRIEVKDSGNDQVAVIKILKCMPSRLRHGTGHKDVVSKDINARDPKGWTALHHAAWNGHVRVIDNRDTK
jgi:ankyrin repeat protein